MSQKQKHKNAHELNQQKAIEDNFNKDIEENYNRFAENLKDEVFSMTFLLGESKRFELGLSFEDVKKLYNDIIEQFASTISLGNADDLVADIFAMKMDSTPESLLKYVYISRLAEQLILAHQLKEISNEK